MKILLDTDIGSESPEKRGQVQFLTGWPISVCWVYAQDSTSSARWNGLPCYQSWRGEAAIVFRR